MFETIGESIEFITQIIQSKEAKIYSQDSELYLELNIIMGVKKEKVAVEKENILAPFTNIGKVDKNRFARLAVKMGISQEELLGLAVAAVVKGKVKFEKKSVYEVK